MSTFKSVRLSVPEAVKLLLTRNHALFQCLKLRVINYRALAARIKPEVEELAGGPVKLSTIVTAIARFAHTVEGEIPADASKLLKDAKLTLTHGVADMTLPTTQLGAFMLFRTLLDLGSELQVHVFQLPGFVKVIGSEKDVRALCERLSSFYQAEVRAGLAGLEVQISPEAEKTPGIASFLSELLYRHGVNLLTALFTYVKILLVVDEAEASRAYELIRGEISR